MTFASSLGKVTRSVPSKIMNEWLGGVEGALAALPKAARALVDDRV